MSRTHTRQHMLQDAAFIDALHRTGNVREAARILGVHHATYMKRRAKDPVFAARWDAALATAHARLADIVAGFSHATFYARRKAKRRVYAQSGWCFGNDPTSLIGRELIWQEGWPSFLLGAQ